MQTGELQNLLEYMIGLAPTAGLLVVSSQPRKSFESAVPAVRNVTWLTGVRTAADLPGAPSKSSAVIFRQLEFMTAEGAVQMLCRLRDIHCDNMLLDDSGHRLGAAELLAIGFYPAAGPQLDGRWFRYDRDQFFEPRQWNTPDKWANPANFGKFRW